VAITDVDDFWLVGFADEEFDTKQYLMLQRSHEDDAQDIALGMNTYHVERNDQGYSGYGGIERFDLYPDRVLVRFNDIGARNLETRVMEISFKKDGRRFGKLQRRLKNIFSGTSCLLVHAADT
jgi:hypothetical protein